MKLKNLAVTLLLLAGTFISFVTLPPTSAPAAIKKLSDSLEKATKAEKKDLGKLLTDVSLAPAVDPATGKNVFKVGMVAKGSVYERTGIKVGDLVEMGYTGMSKNGKLELEEEVEKE